MPWRGNKISRAQIHGLVMLQVCLEINAHKHRRFKCFNQNDIREKWEKKNKKKNAVIFKWTVKTNAFIVRTSHSIERSVSLNSQLFIIYCKKVVHVHLKRCWCKRMMRFWFDLKVCCNDCCSEAISGSCFHRHSEESFVIGRGEFLLIYQICFNMTVG